MANLPYVNEVLGVDRNTIDVPPGDQDRDFTIRFQTLYSESNSFRDATRGAVDAFLDNVVTSREDKEEIFDMQAARADNSLFYACIDFAEKHSDRDGCEMFIKEARGYSGVAAHMDAAVEFYMRQHATAYPLMAGDRDFLAGVARFRVLSEARSNGVFVKLNDGREVVPSGGMVFMAALNLIHSDIFGTLIYRALQAAFPPVEKDVEISNKNVHISKDALSKIDAVSKVSANGLLTDISAREKFETISRNELYDIRRVNPAFARVGEIDMTGRAIRNNELENPSIRFDVYGLKEGRDRVSFKSGKDRITLDYSPMTVAIDRRYGNAYLCDGRGKVESVLQVSDKTKVFEIGDIIRSARQTGALNDVSFDDHRVDYIQHLYEGLEARSEHLGGRFESFREEYKYLEGVKEKIGTDNPELSRRISDTMNDLKSKYMAVDSEKAQFEKIKDEENGPLSVDDKERLVISHITDFQEGNYHGIEDLKNDIEKEFVDNPPDVEKQEPIEPEIDKPQKETERQEADQPTDVEEVERDNTDTPDNDSQGDNDHVSKEETEIAFSQSDDVSANDEPTFKDAETDKDDEPAFDSPVENDNISSTVLDLNGVDLKDEEVLQEKCEEAKEKIDKEADKASEMESRLDNLEAALKLEAAEELKKGDSVDENRLDDIEDALSSIRDMKEEISRYMDDLGEALESLDDSDAVADLPSVLTTLSETPSLDEKNPFIERIQLIAEDGADSLEIGIAAYLEGENGYTSDVEKGDSDRAESAAVADELLHGSGNNSDVVEYAASEYNAEVAIPELAERMGFYLSDDTMMLKDVIDPNAEEIAGSQRDVLSESVVRFIEKTEPSEENSERYANLIASCAYISDNGMAIAFDSICETIEKKFDGPIAEELEEKIVYHMEREDLSWSKEDEGESTISKIILSYTEGGIEKQESYVLDEENGLFMLNDFDGTSERDPGRIRDTICGVVEDVFGPSIGRVFNDMVGERISNPESLLEVKVAIDETLYHGLPDAINEMFGIEIERPSEREDIFLEEAYSVHDDTEMAQNISDEDLGLELEEFDDGTPTIEIDDFGGDDL